jgi:hypothetical protein
MDPSSRDTERSNVRDRIEWREIGEYEGGRRDKGEEGVEREGKGLRYYKWNEGR